MLVDSMKSVHDGLLDRGFKITAALTVVLGWFATAKEPLPQLAAHPEMVPLSYIVLVGCFLPVLYIFISASRFSHGCEKSLKVRGADEAIYRPFAITKAVLVIGMLVQAAMYFFVGASIALRYDPNHSSSYTEARQPMVDVTLRRECPAFLIDSSGRSPGARAGAPPLVCVLKTLRVKQYPATERPESVTR